MKYESYIFDLDGTLLNTLDDLAASCNFALRTYLSSGTLFKCFSGIMLVILKGCGSMHGGSLLVTTC